MKGHGVTRAVPPKLALFGARRSGSSWVFQLLASYITARHPRTQLLSEYFNVGLLRNPYRTIRDSKGRAIDVRSEVGQEDSWVFDWKKTGQRIESVKAPGPHSRDEVGAAVLRRESAKRMEWLLEDRIRFLLKAQPWDFAHGQRLANFLSGECEVICIERRDLRSQVLSDVLSNHTGVTHVIRGTKPPVPARGGFLCERSTVARIAGELAEYYRLKATLSPMATLYYEDILALRSPFMLLGQLGWADWPVRIMEAPRLVRQNPAADYLAYFSNERDLSGWVDEALSHVPGE